MKLTVLVVLVCATFGVCGLKAQSTQSQDTTNMIDAAGSNRPSTVPEGYMITPFGYFHPSCIVTLAKGERQLQDGRIVHIDGSVTVEAPSCAYSHYTQSGIAVAPGSQGPSPLLATPASISDSSTNDPSFHHEWVEDASVGTGSYIISHSAINARWTVPSQPNAAANQILYFFPGFEDIGNTQTILQPVLGWHSGNWTIASYNCCKKGTVVESTPVPVTSGDRIYGSITSTCPLGTSSCPYWNVLSVDLTTGKSTTLENSPSDGQVFNNAEGGVLEAYSISTCDNYPADGKISFEDIHVYGQDGKLIEEPAWTDSRFNTIYPHHPNITPQCGYSVTTTDRRITLTY